MCRLGFKDLLLVFYVTDSLFTHPADTEQYYVSVHSTNISSVFTLYLSLVLVSTKYLALPLPVCTHIVYSSLYARHLTYFHIELKTAAGCVQKCDTVRGVKSWKAKQLFKKGLRNE